jgi:hypothetical protein
MPNRSPKKDPRSLAARLDRAAGDMNAFLLVLAIGLATLDLTCLWAFRMRDLLPAMARATATSTMAINKPPHQKPAQPSNAGARAPEGNPAPQSIPDRADLSAPKGVSGR